MMNKLLLLIRRYLSIPASATVTENYRFNVRTYKKRGNFSPLYSIEWFPFIKLESVQQMTNIYDDDLALFPKYSLNDLMTRKFVFICLYYNVYSKPCLSSEIDCFSKHGWLLLAVKCFRKTLCLRYLTEYSKENKNRSNVQIAQPACDVPGTSPEGPLKFLTSGTSRGPSGDS